MDAPSSHHPRHRRGLLESLHHSFESHIRPPLGRRSFRLRARGHVTRPHLRRWVCYFDRLGFVAVHVGRSIQGLTSKPLTN